MKLNLFMYQYFCKILFFFGIFYFLLSFFFVYYKIVLFVEWELVSLFSNNLLFSLYLDYINMIFMGTVSFISSGILLYSKYYMSSEIFYVRFIMLLLMFIMSMWMLIISGNLMSLLLGWDGLGLTSYLLVIFYNNDSSANAGMLTVLSNRVGDSAIIVAISFMGMMGSWNFDLFFYSNFYFCFFIILAGMTKSAQLPFSAWLPAAMAAPTPVSALVHSSTLVTAGIYLLLRMNKLFEGSYFSNMLLILGTLTMFFSGLSANFESDLKKIVALSTLSQLGLMFMILGLNMPMLTFFHLITHAFFKSTLFMCVGFMIHSTGSAQDNRYMSGFGKKSPMLGGLLIITNMALVGFPFLTGFYSKDIILEKMFMDYYNYYMLMIIMISTGFTFSYSFRLVYVSMGKVSLSQVNYFSEDLELNLFKSVFFLGLMSIVGGFLMSWFYYSDSLMILLYYFEKYLIIFSCILLGIIFYNLCLSSLAGNFNKNKMILYSYFLMWNISYVSTKVMTFFFLKESNYSMKGMDLGWLESCGSQSGQQMFLYMSNKLQDSQFTLNILYYLIFSLGFTGFVYKILM